MCVTKLDPSPHIFLWDIYDLSDQIYNRGVIKIKPHKSSRWLALGPQSFYVIHISNIYISRWARMVKTPLVMSFLWLHIFPSVGKNNKEKLPGYNEESSIMPYFPYIFLIIIIKFNIRGRACRFSWVMGCNFQAGTWILWFSRKFSTSNISCKIFELHKMFLINARFALSSAPNIDTRVS